MNRATPKFWGVYLVHLLSTIHIDPMGFSVSEFNSRLLFQKIGSPSIFCQSPRNEHGKVNTDLQDFLRFLWFCSGKTMKNHTKTKWKSGSSMKTHSLGKKPTNSLSDQELAWVFSCPSCLAPTSGSDVFFFWGGGKFMGECLKRKTLSFWCPFFVWFWRVYYSIGSFCLLR